MKIKSGFVVREVGGQKMVIAIGEAGRQFHGMIKLNTTGADVWQWVSEGKDEEQIVSLLAEKYSVDIQTAQRDVGIFLSKMKEHGIIV